jgi:Ca2+-binding EF-hand superfamily protein
VLGPASRLVGQLFDMLDADGSGFLDEGEGRKFIRLAGGVNDEEEVAYLWNDVRRTSDKNGDGNISRQEFLAYTLGDEELDEGGHFVEVEREQEIRQQIQDMSTELLDTHGSALGQLATKLFTLLDADAGGTLDKPEGLRYLEMTGTSPELLDETWEDIMRTADGDNDGQISLSEFLPFFFTRSEKSDEPAELVAEEMRFHIICLGPVGSLVGKHCL